MRQRHTRGMSAVLSTTLVVLACAGVDTSSVTGSEEPVEALEQGLMQVGQLAMGFTHTCVYGNHTTPQGGSSVGGSSSGGSNIGGSLDNLPERRVACWGKNAYGELGMENTETLGDDPEDFAGEDLPPVSLGSDFTPTAIAAGSTFTCALSSQGKVKCWGRGNKGRLGSGNANNLGDQVGEMGDNLAYVDLGGTVSKIALGGAHACAILTDGSLKCWGYADYGQIATGDTNDRGNQANEMGTKLPVVSLGTGRKAVQISLGSDHSCALLDNNTIKCWGNNGSGRLGLGDTNNRGDEPNEMGDALPIVPLGTIDKVIAVSAGANHTCALVLVSESGNTTQKVKCWGDASKGQLGLGNTADRGDAVGEMGDSLPFVSLGITSPVFAVFAGHHQTCAAVSSFPYAKVKCWGENHKGQLGLGHTRNLGDGSGEMGTNLPYVNITLPDIWVSPTYLFGISYDHVCARSLFGFNDQLTCWGLNANGQLGLGSVENYGDDPDEVDFLPVVL